VKPEGKRTLERFRVDERIILKWISKQRRKIKEMEGHKERDNKGK
jgi:hypothetical protein